MQIALMHKGQAALWVTNGYTSMLKPITIKSMPMGIDNKTGKNTEKHTSGMDG